jgi:hypothetical protein
VDTVLLQLDEQARMDFAAKDAFDAVDDGIADLLRIGTVDGVVQIAVAIDDDQVLCGTEVGFNRGGKAFRSGNGDAEFHGTSLRV